MAAAGVAACLLGIFVGYLALQPELEAQFHGGVLDEDRAWVLWHNVRATVVAFAIVVSVAFAVLGLVPVLSCRLLRQVRGSRLGP